MHNLHIDHVAIRSELKYLPGAKIVNLKCRVFGGKTGPFPMVRVFRVVRPVVTVWFWVEPEPEPTCEYGPFANICDLYFGLLTINELISTTRCQCNRYSQHFLLYDDHFQDFQNILKYVLPQLSSPDLVT